MMQLNKATYNYFLILFSVIPVTIILGPKVSLLNILLIDISFISVEFPYIPIIKNILIMRIILSSILISSIISLNGKESIFNSRSTFFIVCFLGSKFLSKLPKNPPKNNPRIYSGIFGGFLGFFSKLVSPIEL